MAEHFLYKIYYDDCLVYIGRTNQKLQDRLRGHFFKKPMMRTLDLHNVSKIEYAELSTEADMNLYEIYYILKLKPCLNKDDKAKDDLTVSLPELKWNEFELTLKDKWIEKLDENEHKIEDYRRKLASVSCQISNLHKNIPRDKDSVEYHNYLDNLYRLKDREQSLKANLQKLRK